MGGWEFRKRCLWLEETAALHFHIDKLAQLDEIQRI